MNVPTAEELATREAIRTTLSVYCRGIDRCDADVLRQAFHPDAVLDYGRFVGSVDDFIRYSFGRLQTEWVATQHSIGSYLVSLDGDRAFSEAYFRAVLVYPVADDGSQLIRELIGRYADRHERRDGDWRIVRRTVVKDWNDLRDLRNDPDEGFVMGTRDRTDPTYFAEEPAVGLLRP